MIGGVHNLYVVWEMWIWVRFSITGNWKVERKLGPILFWSTTNNVG